MSTLSYLKRLSAICLLALPAAGALAVPITYSAYDSGAGSLAAATNSTAAAASFDAAYTGLSVVDFDSATPGFSFSGDGFVRTTQRCSPALCGYNTSTSGSSFLDVTYNTTFTFASGIDTFGAYFTGVQRGDATLTYSDGSTTVLELPSAELSAGGTAFFGFSDFGASIVSIDYFTGTGGDFVGVDDIRFGKVATSVPEPSTLAILALGLAGLGFRQGRVSRS